MLRRKGRTTTPTAALIAGAVPFLFSAPVIPESQWASEITIRISYGFPSVKKSSPRHFLLALSVNTLATRLMIGFIVSTSCGRMGPASYAVDLAATLSKLASDDAMFFADTVMWLARHIKGGKDRRLFGSFTRKQNALVCRDSDISREAPRQSRRR